MCFFEDAIDNVRHTGTCSIKKYRLYTNVSNVLKKWTIGDNGMSTCFFFLRTRLVMLDIPCRVQKYSFTQTFHFQLEKSGQLEILE